MEHIRELYNYREMIFSLIRRDLKGRYKGSIMGFLWTFLNPLLQLVVYTVVFSTVMRMGIENYEVFLFVTLIPWIFFSTSIIASSGSIIYNQNLITKIYFPREVLPLSVVCSNFINMLYCFVIVLSVVFYTNREINMYLLLVLLVVMSVEFCICLGMSYILSSLTVYFRDLEHILSVVVLAWQFMTPVMYPVSMIPCDLLPLFELNPMFHVITCYRDILYYNKMPNMDYLIYASLYGIFIVILGYVIFSKLKKNFVEEL